MVLDVELRINYHPANVITESKYLTTFWCASTTLKAKQTHTSESVFTNFILHIKNYSMSR